MQKEFDERLCRDYPEIFKDRQGDARKTLMCFGFECGDGWYPLLDFLCRSMMNSSRNAQRKVDYIREQLTQDPTQWNDWQKKSYSAEALAEAEKELAQALVDIPVAVQVKEKFGGLRFYVSGGTEAHQDMINMVEALSYRVCEECGSMMDTTTYTMGWHSTLCPTHGQQKYGQDAEHFRNKTGQFAPGEDDEQF